MRCGSMTDFRGSDFEARTGLPSAAIEPALASGRARGVWSSDGGRVAADRARPPISKRSAGGLSRMSLCTLGCASRHKAAPTAHCNCIRSDDDVQAIEL